MGYQNGRDLLPDKLLAAIQEYIDGAYIYIPRREENRRPWGANTESRLQVSERNREIFGKYRSGQSIQELAREYCLSDKTVYGIVAKMKTD
ncbi:MAG: CD3324 family protein [Lachnospiraceae bacterium]|nr:CD3324 family protein [Lachnospiraceae bacterium]